MSRCFSKFVQASARWEKDCLYNLFSLTTKSSWFLIFQASNPTFCYHLIISFPKHCPPPLPTSLFFHVQLSVFLFFPSDTFHCRLNHSSSTSARTPALARTTALTLSPGPSWVTAPPTPISSAAVSHSTTRWCQPACLAPPPPPPYFQPLKRVILTHSTHSTRDFHHSSFKFHRFAPWVHSFRLSIQSGD